MKADLSTNDIIRIQVVSRLSDLLFNELRKIKLDTAPLERPAHPPRSARTRRRRPARRDRPAEAGENHFVPAARFSLNDGDRQRSK